MIRSLFLLCLTLFCLPLQADPAIQTFRASYTVQFNGFKVGELQRSLQRVGDDSYLSEIQAHTTGIASWFKPDVVTEQSRWRWLNGRPRPDSYYYHYSGRKKDVIEHQKFDWEQMQLSSLRDGKTTHLALESGVLDKLSFEIAMQLALHQGITKGLFPVAIRGKMTEYDFAVVAEESIVTGPFGKVGALKIQRGNTTLWLAPQQHYMLVKIEQRDGNNRATSYITDVSF